MKKSILAIITVLGIAFSSVANTTEVSPYYIKELKQLVKNAPTAYAENVASHYLTIAKASKKMNEADFVLKAADLEALRAAFGSAPKLLVVINDIEEDQKELVLTLETVGDSFAVL